MAALTCAVAHAVETRMWGDDPLVSALGHAIAEEATRLPPLHVTACLVAALEQGQWL